MTVNSYRWWVALGFALTTLSPISGGAAAETLVERGNYLINIMACDGCHTPRGPNGAFVMDKRLSGGAQTWDEPTFRVKGANITPDRETGIGTWTESDLKRALTEGIRPNGIPLAPQMPFAFYKILTPRDLDAIVAVVRSVPAIRNEVQAPVYKAAMHVELIPGAEKPIAEDALSDPLKRGFYLATITHCMDCHGRRPNGEYDFKNWYGGGGHEMSGPYGTVVVRNITSHPTAGIGAWTEAEIKRALLESVGRDGRKFKPPMVRAPYFTRMTEQDLNALVAYIRALPPLE